jgi:hypothetical protein
MEIKSKKEAVYSAAILGIEIGIAVAIRSYFFYKEGRNSASLVSESEPDVSDVMPDVPEESLNGNGDASASESADLPADELAEE